MNAAQTAAQTGARVFVQQSVMAVSVQAYHPTDFKQRSQHPISQQQNRTWLPAGCSCDDKPSLLAAGQN
jgi:hypothetical protein